MYVCRARVQFVFKHGTEDALKCICTSVYKFNIDELLLKLLAKRGSLTNFMYLPVQAARACQRRGCLCSRCSHRTELSLSQFLIIVFLHATRRILHKYRSLLNTMPLIFPISKNKEVWGILYPSTSDIITCTSSQKDWIFSQLQKICAWSASNGPRGLQQTCWLETCLLLVLGVIKKRIRHFQENSLQICELVVLYIPFFKFKSTKVNLLSCLVCLSDKMANSALWLVRSNSQS